jgi:hypothetical protein
MSRLGWFGVFVTAAYIGVFWWFFGAQISQIKTLEPNELGDFFAGVFGPVALFWVVLGFFQQGVELRHSVETLKLQAEELKNSVEQQRELVKASRDQYELDKEIIQNNRVQYMRSIEPDFMLRRAGGSGNGEFFNYTMEIINSGEDALVIEADIHPKPYEFKKLETDILRRGAKISFDVRFFENVKYSGFFEMKISAKNKDRQDLVQSFSLSLEKSDSNGCFFDMDIKKTTV